MVVSVSGLSIGGIRIEEGGGFVDSRNWFPFKLRYRFGTHNVCGRGRHARIGLTGRVQGGVLVVISDRVEEHWRWRCWARSVGDGGLRGAGIAENIKGQHPTARRAKINFEP